MNSYLKRRKSILEETGYTKLALELFFFWFIYLHRYKGLALLSLNCGLRSRSGGYRCYN